jgi:outer membrane protein assembly factor BamB
VSNADWTHRGGSAQHSGVHGALSAAPARVWSVKIGAGNSRGNRTASSPVVSGGKVFVMDARAQVSAVSTAGGLIWSTDLTADFDRGGNVSGGGVAVSANRVYATTGYGELVALDAASGAVVWRQRLGTPAVGAPSVDGGTVYAVGRDGGAMAVAADSGKIKWEVQGTPDTSGMAGEGSAAVGGDAVYIPTPAGEIMAVSLDGQQRLWNAAVSGQRLGVVTGSMGGITGDPVVSGGVIYAGSAGGRTVAIEAKTGKRLWTTNEGALNPPLVVGGSVFVVNDQARLVRLDSATGEVIWSTEMPYFVKDKVKKRKGIFAHYGPVLAGGRIVVASSDGLLRLFDPANGALVGQADIPSGAASAPALAGGLLFVTGKNGQLHAFR